MKANIRFIETSKESLKGYTLVEGFPGIGLVGTITTKHIADQLQCEQIGYIECDLLMPIIRIHKGLPLHPIRIYVNKKYKLVVLVSEQLIPLSLIHSLSKRLLEWANKKGIKRIITVSGIKVEDDKKQHIYGIACNNISKKELERYNVELIEEGITTGITAVILLDIKDKNKFIAYSLLGNVTLNADYMAAAEVIKKLNSILNINIATEPLIDEAKNIERMLKDHIKKITETKESLERFEKGAPMYT